MPTTIVLEKRFESAHLLPNVPPEHKCRRLHGHSFRCEIHVTAPVDPTLGWAMDFSDIDDAFRPLFEQLDHRYLNEVEGLENPTSENIARWIWERLKKSLPQLSTVVISETCDSRAIYTGP